MNFGPCSLFGNPDLAAANRAAAAVVTLTARSIPTMITRPALFLALAALALPAAAMEVSLEMSARLGTAATAQLLAEEVAHTTDAALADKMSCPMGKVGCPLCYNILERWNADGKLPSHADNHCSDVVQKAWRPMCALRARHRGGSAPRAPPCPPPAAPPTRRPPPAALQVPDPHRQKIRRPPREDALRRDHRRPQGGGEPGLHAAQLLAGGRVLHLLLMADDGANFL